MREPDKLKQYPDGWTAEKWTGLWYLFSPDEDVERIDGKPRYYYNESHLSPYPITALWMLRSPYGRARLRALLGVALFVSHMVFNFTVGYGTPWVGFPVGLVVGVVSARLVTKYLFVERKKHGSHRRTKADHRDPQAITYTDPYYRALASFNRTFSGTRTGAWYQHTSANPEPVKRRALPTVRETTPILAQRYALLKIPQAKGRPVFDSVTNWGGHFEADADATCNRTDEWEAYLRRLLTYGGGSGAIHRMIEETKPDAQHRAPDPDCSCGFYAVPADKLPEYAGAYGDQTILLLVELSGRVIEHEAGYRAEHQRVVEARIPHCRWCGHESEFVLFNREGETVGWQCGLHAAFSDTVPLHLDVLAKRTGVQFTSECE